MYAKKLLCELAQKSMSSCRTLLLPWRSIAFRHESLDRNIPLDLVHSMRAAQYLSAQATALFKKCKQVSTTEKEILNFVHLLEYFMLQIDSENESNRKSLLWLLKDLTKTISDPDAQNLFERIIFKVQMASFFAISSVWEAHEMLPDSKREHYESSEYFFARLGEGQTRLQSHMIHEIENFREKVADRLIVKELIFGTIAD